MTSKAVQHMRAISKRDEWETPPELYEHICETAGFMPVLDVAATDANRKCRLRITKDDGALGMEWPFDFFCNPPYSQVADFMKQAALMVKRHRVRGIILTYSKTDTKWWHEFVEGKPGVKVHFVKGRVRFLRDGIPGRYSAVYPSCFIVMRPEA